MAIICMFEGSFLDEVTKTLPIDYYTEGQVECYKYWLVLLSSVLAW